MPGGVSKPCCLITFLFSGSTTVGRRKAASKDTDTSKLQLIECFFGGTHCRLIECRIGKVWLGFIRSITHVNYLSSTCANISTWKIVEMSYINVRSMHSINLLWWICMESHSMNDNFEGSVYYGQHQLLLQVLEKWYSLLTVFAKQKTSCFTSPCFVSYATELLSWWWSLLVGITYIVVYT